MAVWLAAAIAVAGCGGDETGSETPAVVAELCAAQMADPRQAEGRFWKVHARLHELAADVETRDRAIAAELLQAKRTVEDALAEPEQARGRVAGELERLVAGVRKVLATLGRPAPSCDTDPAAS